MSASLLAARLCLIVALAAFLALFLGIARWRRALSTVMVVAIAAFCGFTAARLQDLGDLGDLNDLVAGRWGLVAGGVVGLGVLVAICAYAAWRWPKWALPVVIAVMPIRIPLPVGDGGVHLLLPLYIGALAILIAEVIVRDRLRPPPASIWPAAGSRDASSAGPSDEPNGSSAVAAPDAATVAPSAGRLLRTRDPLRLALSVLIALGGLSCLWAGAGWGPDLVGAAWEQETFVALLTELCAFYVPFAVVLALTYRYVSDEAGLRRLLVTLVGSAAVMAVIGIIQYPTRFLVFNRTRLLADFHDGKGFRSNSLFWDPNMFSRFLIVALILSVVLMIVIPAWRRRLIGVAFLLAGANVLTLSRSGWLALVVGLVAFCFAWLGKRRGWYIVGAAGLALVIGSGVLFAARGVKITTDKLSAPNRINHTVGGRLYLCEGALKMTADYPLGGVGLGNFSVAYSHDRCHRHYMNRKAYHRLTESHTTPLTVLAELGIPGFLAYVWVLVAAFWVTLRRRSPLTAAAAPAHDAPARAGPASGVEDCPDSEPAGPDPERRLYLLRAGFGAVLAALVTHSLLYNAFFEDPYLWLFFGLMLAAAYRLSGPRPLAPS